MDDKQLDRCLQSIGKTCFVKYFHEFSNFKIQSSNLVDTLMKKESYTEKAWKTRISHSRRIIRQGRAKDALRDIIASEKVETGIRRQAGDLLRSI